MAKSGRMKRLKKYHAQSQRADLLAASNKDETIVVLTQCRQEATQAGDEDYRLFFEAELIGYTCPDHPAQIALLDQALAWSEAASPKSDFFLLRNKGVYFSQHDDEQNAIACYDKALEIASHDHISLRMKGSSLSNLGDDQKAIEWFDKALEIAPHDHISLRMKGSSLSNLGDDQKAIEWFDKALAVKPDDYRALYLKGISLRNLGKTEEAIEWFDKALAVKPDDYSALYEKGVLLNDLGKEQDAVNLFNRILEIKPQNHDAFRELGVSYSKLGNQKRAIELFNKALAVKPDDYVTLRNKGVVLSMQGSWQEAVELYQQALAIKPDDMRIIRAWAATLYRMGNYELACEKISLAAQREPEKYRADFFTIFRLVGKNPDVAWRRLFPQPATASIKSDDRLQDIRDFVGTIRTSLGEKGQEFLRQKEAAEGNVAMFLQPESLLSEDRSLFLVLRKWNSYTPAIPADTEERSRGGGYFIYHNGKGTVIDPGYNFIENFHNAGCRIHDIDNIVITHAHNDHTIDFESICTLLYQYNSKAGKAGTPKKKIRLYFNNGTFKKFSGLLNLMDKNFDTIHTLNVDNRYQLQVGLTLTVLPAYHDEVVSRDQSIGLLFTFDFGGTEQKIVFTSDTGLFPLCTVSDGLRPDTKGKELWEAYPASALENINLLVTHIGSIKTEELNFDLNDDIGKCLYPNHLGMIGTARMITKLRPKLALVSEFGEEMRNFRRDIVKRIEEDVVCKVISKAEIRPRLAPADLAFVYDIADAKFLCCADYQWVDANKIDYDYENDRKEDLYYFCDSTLSRIGRSEYAATLEKY